MSQISHPSLEQILAAQVEQLAATRRPGTVTCYRTLASQFLHYLRATHPQVRRLSQLRRDPHLLGWLRSLCQRQPPLANWTRRQSLFRLRRLLEELAVSGHRLRQGLILRQDFPPIDHYLPRPLSPEDDQRLEQQLRQSDDLLCNALLLLRYTGLRIGECLQLSTDCLRHLGQDQWALHVPLGKLHTERWVPVDDHLRKILDRLLALRGPTPSGQPVGRLLTLPNGRRGSGCSARVVGYRLRRALRHAAQQAGCTLSPQPHQLRHTYATELLRAGASLPAVQQLLGHSDIRMTLRYVQVAQNDLQREYHRARHILARRHSMPPLPGATTPHTSSQLPALSQSLAAAYHLLEMHRRNVTDQALQRHLRRLANRLFKITAELANLIGPLK